MNVCLLQRLNQCTDFSISDVATWFNSEGHFSQDFSLCLIVSTLKMALQLKSKYAYLSKETNFREIECLTQNR